MSAGWVMSIDELEEYDRAWRKTDAAKIALFSDLLDDPEALERARARATEIVTRAAADGSLERLASALEQSSSLDGTRVADILRPPGTGSTPPGAGRTQRTEKDTK